MGARALLTVCRFENLVTGLNLFKQFEFHVKAPLTAHICSASRSAPQLCRNISGMGAVAGVWEQRMLKRGQESWGWRKRRGKEGKLRGAENLGTSNLNKLYQSPRKFSCRMKACNFGKFGGSRQSSKKLCVAPRAPAEASQINLIKRGEKISSDCSLPCLPLEERKKTYKVPFQMLGCGTELRRATPSHTCITAPCVN